MPTAAPENSPIQNPSEFNARNVFECICCDHLLMEIARGQCQPVELPSELQRQSICTPLLLFALTLCRADHSLD